METLKLTEKRMQMLLPENIKNSDVLTTNDKKVLGAIMNAYATLEIVKNTGYYVCPNEALRNITGIKQNSLIESIQNLIDCKLITREVGERYTKGKRPKASIYRVVWENIKKPVVKKTFDELFSTYLDAPKIKVGTIDIDSDIDNDIDNEIDIDTVTDDETIIEDKEYNNILKNNIYNKKDNLNNILKKEDKMNSKKDNIKEDKTIDKPKNYKELGDYLRKRVNEGLKQCKTSQDIQQLKEEIIKELNNDFNYIPSYTNCLFSLNSYFSNKIEELSPSLTVIEVKGI